MGFRIKRVGHLVLRVKDVERSRRFFEDTLGLPVVAQNERGMFFSVPMSRNAVLAPPQSTGLAE